MIISILKANPLFYEFADSEIKLLIQLCEPLRLKKGEELFREGAKDDGALYFIEEGIIKILKSAPEGRRVLAMFGLGNFFGEMSFLSPGPRSATAAVDEDAVLYKLQPDHFLEMQNDSPGTVIKMLKVFNAKLVARLRETDEALMKHDSGKIIVT